MLVSEPWAIDKLTITRAGDAVVEMIGWAFPDPSSAHHLVVLRRRA